MSKKISARGEVMLSLAQRAAQRRWKLWPLSLGFSTLIACAPVGSTRPLPDALATVPLGEKPVVKACAAEAKEARVFGARVEEAGARLLDLSQSREGGGCVSFVADDAQAAAALVDGWQGKWSVSSTLTAAELDTTQKPTVYDDFDTPDNGNADRTDDGIRAQIEGLAARHPNLFTLHTLGFSHQKRPIYALEATLADGDQADLPDGGQSGKPNVLFVGVHHAREWVTADLSMRLARYLADNQNQASTRLRLTQTRIWIVPVLNPDGYQFTFDGDRLWRKNLRDNNRNGVVDAADGVDLNRNYPYKWAFDGSGSSDAERSGTYRGPEPGSEPETQALMDLMKRVRFEYSLSYHSYGNLILYPSGFRGFDPTPDEPLFSYLAGSADRPAIWDSSLNKPYFPTLSAGLYVTNGEFTDWAYHETQSLSYTVELTDHGDGFQYPDDEQLLQTLFTDNLPFINDLIDSSQDLERPVSHIQKQPLAPVVHESIQQSFGDRQLLEVRTLKGRSADLVTQSLDDQSLRERRRLSVTGRGVVYETQQAVVHGLGSADRWGYHFEITGHPTERSRYPEDGVLVFRVRQSPALPYLLVYPASVSASGPKDGGADARGTPGVARADLERLEESLAELGVTGQFDRLPLFPEDRAPFFDVLSHYKGVIWVDSDGGTSASGPSSELSAETRARVAQLSDWARYLREGGTFWLVGAQGLDRILQTVEAEAVTNFLLEAFGIEEHNDGAGRLMSRSEAEPLSVRGGGDRIWRPIDAASLAEGPFSSLWLLQTVAERGFTEPLQLALKAAYGLELKGRAISALRADASAEFVSAAKAGGSAALVQLETLPFRRKSSAYVAALQDVRSGERFYLAPVEAQGAELASSAVFENKEDPGLCLWLRSEAPELAAAFPDLSEKASDEPHGSVSCLWDAEHAAPGLLPVFTQVSPWSGTLAFDLSAAKDWLMAGESAGAGAEQRNIEFVLLFVDGEQDGVEAGSVQTVAAGPLYLGGKPVTTPVRTEGAFAVQAPVLTGALAVGNSQTLFTPVGPGAFAEGARLATDLARSLGLGR